MRNYIRDLLSRHKKALAFIYLFWGSYFVILFSKMISFKSDGIWVGHVNVWSDWALHISIANTFALKPLSFWFSFNPLYAGGKATYPFMADAISGILMRLGLSLENSFIFPSIILSLLLIAGVYFLGYLLLKSKTSAVISVFIFFLTPSLGFIKYLINLFNSNSFFTSLYPVLEYSRFDKYDWYSGNIITGLLIPQRAFLMGITITVWIIIGLIYVLSREKLKENNKKEILLISGIMAGILPVTHPHSFIALIIISIFICFTFIKRWKELLWYVIPATIISSVLFSLFIYGGIENSSFVSWYPGWSAKEGGIWEWLIMWFWLSSISIPLAILGWFLVIRDKISHSFFSAMLFIFIIANLFLFQPIRWDNSKLFFWSFLGFAYLGSATIYWFWKNNKYLYKIIAIILLFSITATGLLEAIRLQNTKANGHVITSYDDINLGKEIYLNTDQSAIFLTAPIHNHFIMVWGLRQILMGYKAWVWNFGFLHNDREEDLKEIYLGNERTEELIRKHKISYVVIGPPERHDLKANEGYFSSRFPLVFKNLNNNVYDVRSLML